MKITERKFNKEFASNLIKDGLSWPLARALAARGIEKLDDLSLEWSGMLPPNLLGGLKSCTDRLIKARNNLEHVVVIADYDCDGATACAVAIRGLKMMGIKVSYFVPDRAIHGYGLSNTIVDIVRESFPDVSLLITVDNGMSSWEAVKKAHEFNIDTIITDHHLPGEKVPEAVSIVNPNALGEKFPSKNLAGVGVIYYVLLALRARLREMGVYTKETQPRLDSLVDLVALGTVADVVKLDKNNRILISQGLKRIRANKTHVGITELFRVAGKDYREATTKDFGFAIGPRINAAGRLSSMASGIECLLTDDIEKAQALAVHLNSYNKERKSQEDEMQITAEISLGHTNPDKKTIVVYDDSYAEGIVGLVASRLKEKHHRPTFAFAKNDAGLLKGSGRSIPGIHMRDILCLVDKEIPGEIIKFGGHAMAAGLTLKAEALHKFKETFEKVVSENTVPELFTKEILTDGPLQAQDITENFCQTISNLIWGQGFDEPIFSNEVEVSAQRILKDTHTKFLAKIGNRTFDAIYFRHVETLPRKVRLAYQPQINEFNGRKTIQLLVVGYEEA